MSDNDVVLVVGGAGALLDAVVRRQVRTGSAVVVAVPAPSEEREVPASVAALRDELTASGDSCEVATFWPREPREFQELVDRLASSMGVPRVVVTVPVGSDPVAAHEMSDDDWERAIDLNVHACYCAMRALLPRMQPGGRIVAVVGREARRGVAFAAHTAGAHWAVLGLVKSAALEAAASGVALNAVVAGPLDDGTWDREEVQRRLLEEAGAVETAPSRSAVEAALSSMHPTGQAFVPVDAVLDTVDFLVSRPDTALTGSVIDVSQGRAALNTA